MKKNNFKKIILISSILLFNIDTNVFAYDCVSIPVTCEIVYVCPTCDNIYASSSNSIKYSDETEIRNHTPATCVNDGYTGDTYCTSCNTKLLGGTIIPATEHIDNNCDLCQNNNVSTIFDFISEIISDIFAY